MHLTTQFFAHIRPERLLSVLLWSLLCVLICAYAYFVILAVTHVVLREELALAIEHEEARISELETSYFARAARITEKTAQEMGLVMVEKAGYVTVGGEGKLSRAE